MNLDQLGLKHGTDQSSNFHAYCETMEEYLGPLRDKPIILMEQGILAGQGLRMWSEYLTHPDALIIGVDPHTFDRPPIDDPRVMIVQGKQEDAKLMAQIYHMEGQLDWVTDDASHFASAQQKSFPIIWPYIKPGGYWCCQDLHTHAAPELCDAQENVMQWLTRMATEMQDIGATGRGKRGPDRPWSDIDWICFRRGLCIIRKANG